MRKILLDVLELHPLKRKSFVKKNCYKSVAIIINTRYKKKQKRRKENKIKQNRL